MSKGNGKNETTLGLYPVSHALFILLVTSVSRGCSVEEMTLRVVPGKIIVPTIYYTLISSLITSMKV